jgi:hypothetical protein
VNGLVETAIEAGVPPNTVDLNQPRPERFARPLQHAMTMTELLRNHRLALYAVFSAGLVAAVVLNALQNHSNFFAAAFAMSQSNGSIMVNATCGPYDGGIAMH